MPAPRPTFAAVLKPVLSEDLAADDAEALGVTVAITVDTATAKLELVMEAEEVVDDVDDVDVVVDVVVDEIWVSLETPEVRLK